MTNTLKTMGRKLTLLSLAALLAAPASSQNCLPEGILFGQQWEVNNFPVNYPGCTHIVGPVTFGASDLITDLTPLSQLTSVGHDLIFHYPLGLTNLHGLHNLTTVGRDLKIENADNLVDLTALSNITSIGRDLIIQQNMSVTSLNGLGSITTVGGRLNIYQMDGLTDLTGLEGVMNIGGNCGVEGNAALVSMNGLSPQSVGLAFWAKGNPQLTDLSAASGLNSIGGLLNLQDNTSLPTLEDLMGVTALGGYLRIQNCPQITDLSPLANIDPATITQLVLQDLPGVSGCAIASVCAYLALPNAQPTIANNASGCASVAEVEAACATTAIHGPSAPVGMALQVFPNPSNGMVQLQASVQGAMDLHVIDLVGRTVHQEQVYSLAGELHALNLGHLMPGGYLLHMQSGQGIATARLIIE